MAEEIETTEALDALPDGSLLMEADGHSWFKHGVVLDLDPGFICEEGVNWSAAEVIEDADLPLTVLYRPDAPAPSDESDGHHTMDELYEYRMLYNAHAALGWLAAGVPVVKSWRHSDGEPCFGGGWFIVVATLPTGQVSNHYAAEFWDLFDVPEADLPPAYDGHTPQAAADRLRESLRVPAPAPSVTAEQVVRVADEMWDQMVGVAKSSVREAMYDAFDAAGIEVRG